MNDEFANKDDDAPLEDPTAAEMAEADLAEAAEAVEAVEESPDEVEADRAAQIAEAVAANDRHEMQTRVWWSGVSKEHFTMLLANCLFFAGALAAWDRFLAFEAGSGAKLTGLDTIRGSVIFGLAIYGFFVGVFNIWFRQLKIWPFLVNAVLGLWVGVSVISDTIGSERWVGMTDWADGQKMSYLLKFLAPFSAIPPGIWLITLGGLLVVWVLLKGILGGRAQARSSARSAGSGSRRRAR